MEQPVGTTIREARPEDVPELRRTYGQLDTYHFEALPHLFRAPDDPIAARELLTAIEDVNTALLVAERDGCLAGFVGARVVETGPSDPVYQPRRFAYVDDMAVLPAFRRAGIGRALLDAVEEWARKREVETIELTVFEFNEGARLLYERAGFHTLQRRMQKGLQ